MGLVNSTNPKIMAENITKLDNMISGGSILPSVNISDEGKVLTVDSNGKWAAEEPVEELPSVTTTDEGKVLTVNSSGEWEVDDLPIPDTSTASPGQILKLDSNKDLEWANEYSYTPPAYSTTEHLTGKLWIDGKEIYEKTINVGEITVNTDYQGDLPSWRNLIEHGVTFDTLIGYEGYVLSSDGTRYGLSVFRGKGAGSNMFLNVGINTTHIAVINTWTPFTDCYVTMRYTKPTPTTRKKSTK